MTDQDNHDPDYAAFLRQSRRRSFVRRGQSHFNPPHLPPSTDLPPPVVHKQPDPMRTENAILNALSVLLLVLFIIFLIYLGYYYGG
jgi:hypothetical protein